MSSNTSHGKVLIVSCGPARYMAAIYGARVGLALVLINGLDFGGQIAIATDVENYTGFADSVQSSWLVDLINAQAEREGNRVVHWPVGNQAGRLSQDSPRQHRQRRPPVSLPQRGGQFDRPSRQRHKAAWPGLKRTVS